MPQTMYNSGLHDSCAQLRDIMTLSVSLESDTVEGVAVESVLIIDALNRAKTTSLVQAL